MRSRIFYEDPKLAGVAAFEDECRENQRWI